VSTRGKAMVCRCEDVTVSDVKKAIAAGYEHIEEIKRYTGFGTGPCQGKECHAVAALLIGELTGNTATIAPFTSRAPLSPTPLKLFARDPSARPITSRTLMGFDGEKD